MNLPDVGGEPQRVQIGLADGKTATFDGLVTNVSFGMSRDDASEVNLTIVPTGLVEMVNEPVGTWTGSASRWGGRTVPCKGDVVAISEPVVYEVRSLGLLQPFVYGFGYLLLLWGCMTWEKWIGWVGG